MPQNKKKEEKEENETMNEKPYYLSLQKRRNQTKVFGVLDEPVGTEQKIKKIKNTLASS